MLELLALPSSGGKKLFAQRRAARRSLAAARNDTGETPFAASLDADSEVEEGKFSSGQERDRRADRAKRRVLRAHTTSRRRQFRGPHYLEPAADGARSDARRGAAFRAARDSFWSPRRARAPRLDDKVLADWNGLIDRRAGQCELFWMSRHGSPWRSAPSISSRAT